PLEENAEEAHQLLALRDRALLPVMAERPLRDFGKIKEFVGYFADRGSAVGLTEITTQLGIVEDAKHLLKRRTHLLGRRRRRPRGECGRHGQKHRGGGDEEATGRNHREFPRERSGRASPRRTWAVAVSSNGPTAATVIVSPRHNSSVSIKQIRRSL